MSVVPFIARREPNLRAIDANLIELRLTDAERNVYLGVADFTIALEQANDAPTCFHLSERVSRLLLALGAVADSAQLKGMDFDAS